MLCVARVAADGRTIFRAVSRVAADRIVRTTTTPWGELRDSCFAGLRRVALPFADVFPLVSWRHPAEWPVRERVEQELAKFSFQTAPPFDHQSTRPSR